jgi:hypothetical protein
MIAVRNRLRFDWAPRVFFGALIIVVIATGILDFYTRFNQYRPVGTLKPESSESDWPTLSNDDIRELGKTLVQYHPNIAEISYGDEKDKPIAVSFAQAMFIANWPTTGVGMSGTIIGIQIAGNEDSKPAMNAIRDFCKVKLGVEPTISMEASNGRIDLMIGTKPLP